MSIHASIHVENNMEVQLVGSRGLIISTGLYGIIFVDRDVTPGFFDALIEFFDLQKETAPGDQTGDGTTPEISHTQILGDHRE